MNKAYSRINNGNGWEDYPSDKTPINKKNLDKGDIALDEIDNRVIILDDTKATKVEISELFKSVEYDERTGIITFTRKNGGTVTIDTPMEKIQTGIYYNPASEKLILPLVDGTSIEVDLSRLMKYDEFLDSGTIAFYVNPDGKISAIVKEGSIEGRHLRPDYLADIKIESGKAEIASQSAEEKAKMAESFAHGGTGVRPNENTDNAEYYKNQAKVYYDNLQQAGSVTGVKGNSESIYRKGNVNITPENIGSPSNEYISGHFVPDYVSTSRSLVASQGWYRIAETNQYGYSSCVISLKRSYNSPGPEYQKIQLMSAYTLQKFVVLAAYSHTHFWKKIRETWDEEDSKAYIEIYQDRNSSVNAWQITIEDALSGANPNWRWEAIEARATEESKSGVSVLASIDLPANFDSAHNIMDSGNSNNISFSYYKPASTSPSWLAAWDGYELRKISSSTYIKKDWDYIGFAYSRGGNLSHSNSNLKYSEYLIATFNGEDFKEFTFHYNLILQTYQSYPYGGDSNFTARYNVSAGNDIIVSFSMNDDVITFTNSTSNYYVRVYAK